MRHLLVFQLARFGDLVQSKRLLLSLAGERDAVVHLCVDPSLAAIAGAIYPFAHIHTLPAMLSSLSSVDILTTATKTFQEFKQIDFSAVYTLNFSRLSFACAALFDPAIVHGYSKDKGQELRAPFLSLSFNFMRDRRFAPLNLVDLWAFLHPSPIAPEKVNPIPRPAGEGRIGIVMAGRESRRSLPAPALAEIVMSVFQARQGPRLVCLGSRSESPHVRKLTRHLSAQATARMEDLTGKTSLSDLLEILPGLDMLITPDTGSMHLAAHLGVPVQAFFLSSAWCHETGPYGLGHLTWQTLESCSPCREASPCHRTTACLAPFSHQAFLAHLRGKNTGEWPAGLLGYTGSLDSMGSTYKLVDGEDPYAEGRLSLRTALADFLRQKRPCSSNFSPAANFLELLYTESDWMLPGDQSIQQSNNAKYQG